MKQSEINPGQIVHVNLTGSAKALQPTVYKDGNLYFCLLGPDYNVGVGGSGKTTQHALTDWDKNLQIRLKANDDNDIIVQMVKELLKKKKEAALNQLDDFYGRFRPVKK